VLTITCLDLVPFVEAGAQMSEACLATLKKVLQPAVEQNVDYLVLGCTHYPFLKGAIQHIFGQKMTLIDSGAAVARQTARILIKNELLFEHDGQPEHVRIECYVSGQNADQLKPILSHLIASDLTWSIKNIGI